MSQPPINPHQRKVFEEGNNSQIQTSMIKMTAEAIITLPIMKTMKKTCLIISFDPDCLPNERRKRRKIMKNLKNPNKSKFNMSKYIVMKNTQGID